MKIPGYPKWFGVFKPWRWLAPLAEQAYDVAGVFLAADRPLVDETVCELRRITGELVEIRTLLTSAPAPVRHSPTPEDAAEEPRAARPPHTTEGGAGHPKVEEIPDEYWDWTPIGVTR